MKISELKAKQGKVDIEVEIVSVDEPREFQKFGNSGRVANATAKDDSGEIKVSLWNEQVDQVKAGDKIKITNGYVNEYQGELQLGTGKFGQLEVTSGGAEPEAPGAAPEEVEGTPEEEMTEETPDVKEEKI